LSKKKASILSLITLIITFRSFGSFESEKKKQKVENSPIQIIRIKEYTKSQIRSVNLYQTHILNKYDIFRIVLRFIYTPTEDPIEADDHSDAYITCDCDGDCDCNCYCDYCQTFNDDDAALQIFELSKMTLIEGFTDFLIDQALYWWSNWDGILNEDKEEYDKEEYGYGIDFMVTVYKIALKYEQKRDGQIPEEFLERNLKERVEYQFKKEGQDIMKTGLPLYDRNKLIYFNI